MIMNELEIFRTLCNKYPKYQKDIIALNLQKEQITYMMQGVRGVDTSKEPNIRQPYENKIMDFSSKLDSIDKKIKEKRLILQYVEKTIRKCGVMKGHIAYVYLLGNSMDKLAEKLDISRRQLYKVMNNSMSECLNFEEIVSVISKNEDLRKELGPKISPEVKS